VRFRSRQDSVTAPPARRSARLTRSRQNKSARIAVAASIAAIVLQSWPARTADLFASGDQTRELCSSSEEWCVGFVTGALDGWAALEAYYTGDTFCLPADLTTGRIVEIFVQELEQRPEARDEPSAYILYERLIELYPCK
jgi:Rap1a immunity proteins